MEYIVILGVLLLIIGAVHYYNKKSKINEIDEIVNSARSRANMKSEASADFRDIDPFKTSIDLHTAITLTEVEMYPKFDEVNIDRSRKETIERILGSDFQEPTIDQNNSKEKP